MTQAEVVAAVADWIDTQVIAESILEELSEYEIEPTVANAKKVWLDILGAELIEAVRSTIRHIF